MTGSERVVFGIELRGRATLGEGSGKGVREVDRKGMRVAKGWRELDEGRGGAEGWAG